MSWAGLGFQRIGAAQVSTWRWWSSLELSVWETATSDFNFIIFFRNNANYANAILGSGDRFMCLFLFDSLFSFCPFSSNFSHF